MSKGQEAAFPYQPRGADGLPVNEHVPGLTKRECFAVMAMQGLCVQAIPGTHNSLSAMVIELPEKAVAIADALLAELAKATGEKS